MGSLFVCLFVCFVSSVTAFQVEHVSNAPRVGIERPNRTLSNLEKKEACFAVLNKHCVPCFM